MAGYPGLTSAAPVLAAPGRRLGGRAPGGLTWPRQLWLLPGGGWVVGRPRADLAAPVLAAPGRRLGGRAPEG